MNCVYIASSIIWPKDEAYPIRLTKLLIKCLNFKIILFTDISRVSCKKGPTRHAYASQIGSFWQDTHDMSE